MQRKALFPAFAILLLVVPGILAAQAESRDTSLQHQVVVTATRIETPLKEIASSITVITRQELERSKRRTVIEVLKDVPGIMVIQSGPPGSSASVMLRGTNSEHTLVMVDGVEVNDPMTPSRTCDLAHLTVESVERIEILRGPQSTLYGSDAMGGVIHIITRKGGGKPRFHFSSLAGSYGTFSATAGGTGEVEKLRYSLWFSGHRTRGFSAASATLEGNSEDDGYNNSTISARLGYTLSDGWDVDFSFRSLRSRTEIDNFGGAFGDDPNNIQEYDSTSSRGEIRGLFLKNRWEQKLVLSSVVYDRENDNPLDDLHPLDSDRSRFRSRIWKMDWQHNLFLREGHTLTFGMGILEEKGESTYHALTWGVPFSSSFPSKRTKTTAFYAQDQFRVGGGFFLTAGFRMDNHSRAGHSFTYRIAPAWFIQSTGTKIKATYGTGFKSPSLYQLFAPGTAWGPVGNETLHPEKTEGWDAGVEQELWEGKVRIAGTAFSLHMENLIDFDYTKGFVNVARAFSRGYELQVSLRPSEALRLEASYTRTRAEDRNTGQALLRRPRDKFTARLNLEGPARTRLALTLVHTGSRPDTAWVGWLPTRVRLPGFTLLNASLSWDLWTGIQAFIRLDNLLDSRYELIKGYGTPGFSGFGGVVILF